MTFIPRLRRSSSRMGRRWVPDVFQQLLTVRNVLAVLWAYLVWKGERRVFDDAVKSCDWNAWETWVCLFPLSSSSFTSLPSFLPCFFCSLADVYTHHNMMKSAFRSPSTSYCAGRRPSDRRRSLIPQDIQLPTAPHTVLYGSLPLPNIFCNSTEVTTGYYHFPWRSVRWRP